MSSFRTFGTAYKKAISNNRRPRDAVQYALNKHVAYVIDKLNLYADAETRECFVDEAFEIYCNSRNDDDTHVDAARAATKYIERSLKAAEAEHGSRGKTGSSSRSRGHGSSTPKASEKPFVGTRGKPVYNYNDPRNNKAPSSARSKLYDDARPSSSTRAKTAYHYEESYESKPKSRHASEHGSYRKDASRSRGEPLYDYEDMYEADRDSDHRRKDWGGSSSDEHAFRYDGDYSSTARGRSDRDRFHNGSGSHHGRSDSHHGRSNSHHSHSESHHGAPNAQWPPMPAGFGRFEFPSPIFTKGSSNSDSFFSDSFFSDSFFPEGFGSSNSDYFFSDSFFPEGFGDSHGDSFFSTHEFRPSYHSEREFHTREFRPSEHAHNTRGFKPSWYESENSRPEENRHEYAYTSSSHTSSGAPPPHSHKSSRPSPSSYEPPSTSGIKPLTCFYTVLGLSRTATQGEIKTAYRKMSMKHHPDRVVGADKDRATAKMAEINQANDVLSDEEKRRYYDMTGCVPGLGRE